MRTFQKGRGISKGKKMGVKLGFPTINLKLDFLPPLKMGVYAVKVRVKDKWYDAVANYGFAPTIKQDPLARNSASNFRVHLFDFNENIYYQKVLVFLYFPRPLKSGLSLLVTLMVFIWGIYFC